MAKNKIFHQIQREQGNLSKFIYSSIEDSEINFKLVACQNDFVV